MFSTQPKRKRKQTTATSWQSTAAPQRSRVLLLGMSYTDVEGQLHCQRVDKRTLMNKEAGVRQVIELVERKILTEIDGRDQARCLAMEEENVWEAHTVSNGDGAMYCGLKHLYADFNKRSFIGLVKDKWLYSGAGKTDASVEATSAVVKKRQKTNERSVNVFKDAKKFSQIILDYFWIPDSWAGNHWRPSFYSTNLPAMKDILLPDTGAIYLPFCGNCFKNLVAAAKAVNEVYKIELIRREGLKEISLWKHTHDINGKVMQTVLGKNINQEEEYCNLKPLQLKNNADSVVTLEQLKFVYDWIDEVEDVKFMKLTLLKGEGKKKETGGFVHMHGKKGKRPPLTDDQKYLTKTRSSGIKKGPGKLRKHPAHPPPGERGRPKKHPVQDNVETLLALLTPPPLHRQPPTLQMLSDLTRPVHVQLARFNAWRLSNELVPGVVSLLMDQYPSLSLVSPPKHILEMARDRVGLEGPSHGPSKILSDPSMVLCSAAEYIRAFDGCFEFFNASRSYGPQKIWSEEHDQCIIDGIVRYGKEEFAMKDVDVWKEDFPLLNVPHMDIQNIGHKAVKILASDIDWDALFEKKRVEDERLAEEAARLQAERVARAIRKGREDRGFWFCSKCDSEHHVKDIALPTDGPLSRQDEWFCPPCTSDESNAAALSSARLAKAARIAREAAQKVERDLVKEEKKRAREEQARLRALEARLGSDREPCQGCGVAGDKPMLACDACAKEYHLHCCWPVISEAPESKWFCEDCGNGCSACVTVMSGKPYETKTASHRCTDRPTCVGKNSEGAPCTSETPHASLKFCLVHRKVAGEDGKCAELHPQDEGFVMPEVEEGQAEFVQRRLEIKEKEAKEELQKARAAMAVTGGGETYRKYTPEGLLKVLGEGWEILKVGGQDSSRNWSIRDATGTSYRSVKAALEAREAPPKTPAVRQPPDEAVYGKDDDTCAGCMPVRAGRSTNEAPNTPHTCTRAACVGKTAKGAPCSLAVSVSGGSKFCPQDHANLETAATVAVTSADEVAAMLEKNEKKMAEETAAAAAMTAMAVAAAVSKQPPSVAAKVPLDEAIYGQNDGTCIGCTRIRAGGKSNWHVCVRETCAGQAKSGDQCGNTVAICGAKYCLRLHRQYETASTYKAKTEAELAVCRAQAAVALQIRKEHAEKRVKEAAKRREKPGKKALDEAIYGQDNGTCYGCTRVRAGKKANQSPAVFHCCSRRLCAGKTQTTGDSCTKSVSVFGATVRGREGEVAAEANKAEAEAGALLRSVSCQPVSESPLEAALVAAASPVDAAPLPIEAAPLPMEQLTSSAAMVVDAVNALVPAAPLDSTVAPMDVDPSPNVSSPFSGYKPKVPKYRQEQQPVVETSEVRGITPTEQKAPADA